METGNPLHVRSFDHFTIIVADLARTRDFYVEGLGLQEAARPAFDFPGAWFAAGPFMIHATVADELAGKAGWGDRGVRRISRGHHFAFEIADVEEAARRLDEMQIEIADGPKLRPDGFLQIYIRDPDEHLIELFSRPRS